MIRSGWVLVGRELSLAWRTGTEAWIALAFFAIAASLFPLGVGPDPNLLARMASGIVAICGLLAALLTVERSFHGDLDDGTWDLLAVSGPPLEIVCAAKMIGHWLTTGLPLAVAATPMAISLGMDGPPLAWLPLTMALATAVLSLLGGMAAALTLGARRGGILVALLVFPLIIPSLVFAVGAVEAASTGLPVRPHLLLLTALVVVLIPATPVAAAAAVRQSLS